MPPGAGRVNLASGKAVDVVELRRWGAGKRRRARSVISRSAPFVLRSYRTAPHAAGRVRAASLHQLEPYLPPNAFRIGGPGERHPEGVHPRPQPLQPETPLHMQHRTLGNALNPE